MQTPGTTSAGDRFHEGHVQPQRATARRRSAAVFVRIPRLDEQRHVPPPPTRSAPPPRLEQRHVNEQTLLRVRREFQPAVSHSVRNTIILILILLAAASLTVWITQGIAPSRGVQAPSTSNATLLDDDEELAAVLASDTESDFASWPPPWQGASGTAPEVSAWPPRPADPAIGPIPPAARLAEQPHRPGASAGFGQAPPWQPPRVQEGLVPNRPLYEGPITGGAPVSAAAAGQRQTASPTQNQYSAGPYDGPVASLRPIEPVRR